MKDSQKEQIFALSEILKRAKPNLFDHLCKHLKQNKLLTIKQMDQIKAKKEISDKLNFFAQLIVRKSSEVPYFTIKIWCGENLAESAYAKVFSSKESVGLSGASNAVESQDDDTDTVILDKKPAKGQKKFCYLSQSYQ